MNLFPKNAVRLALAALLALMPGFLVADTNFTTTQFDSSVAKDLSLAKKARIQQLVQESQSSLNEFVEQILGGATSKIPVIFYSQDGFQRMSSTPSWSIASFEGNKVHISLPQHGKISAAQLRKIVSHELIHALISQATAGRCPRWLDEGLAMLFEGNHSHYHAQSPVHFRGSGVDLTLVDAELVSPSREAARIRYQQARFATDYLLTFARPEELKHFFSLLKSGRETQQAFEQGFSISLTAFTANLKQL